MTSNVAIGPLKRKPLTQTEISPVAFRTSANGTLFLDFGRAAFGTLLVPFPSASKRQRIIIHLGEMLSDNGCIERHPPGSIRYLRLAQPLIYPGRIRAAAFCSTAKRSPAPYRLRLCALNRSDRDGIEWKAEPSDATRFLFSLFLFFLFLFFLAEFA